MCQLLGTLIRRHGCKWHNVSAKLSYISISLNKICSLVFNDEQLWLEPNNYHSTPHLIKGHLWYFAAGLFIRPCLLLVTVSRTWFIFGTAICLTMNIPPEFIMGHQCLFQRFLRHCEFYRFRTRTWIFTFYCPATQIVPQTWLIFDTTLSSLY